MSDAKAETEAAFAVMKQRVPKLDDAGLDLLFREARTCYGWQDKKVPVELLRKLMTLTQLPPTSANTTPARFVFASSDAAKEKFLPCLMSGNVEKVKQAPVTAIIAIDEKFYEKMDKLFPHGSMQKMFEDSPEFAEVSGFRNGTLMGAYMILAARSLGLDCGPMSGFDNAKVDETFFKGTTYKSNFICSLGYGDPASVKPRGYKFSFDEIAEIV